MDEDAAAAVVVSAEREFVDVALRHRREVVAKFSTPVDVRSGAELEQVLVDAVRRRGGDDALLAEYEMEWSPACARSPRTTSPRR